MDLKELWKKLIDNIFFIKAFFITLRNWGKNSSGKKLLVYLSFSIMCLSLPTYYVHLWFDGSKVITSLNQTERENMVKKHGLESAIEIVNLCITARDTKSSLKEYYCEFSKIKYKEFSVATTIDTEAQDKIKNENAYGLMILDMNGQLKNLEYFEMQRNLPKDNFGELLNTYLKDFFLYLFIFVYLLLMLSLMALFEKK